MDLLLDYVMNIAWPDGNKDAVFNAGYGGMIWSVKGI